MQGMTRIIVLDRTDTYLCELDPSLVIGIDYVDEIGSVHDLTITTTQELEKTNRLLICDGMGLWHEYVVLGIVGSHGASRDVLNEYYCVWSLQYDLSATFVNNQYGCGIVPGHASVPQTARHALEIALEGTSRWAVGTVTVTTMAAASFYRRSGWEGLQTVTERWGGELQATIDVTDSGNGITVSRAVDLLEHIGKEEATRRFDFGHDVTSIKRTVSDDVWPCRIVPLGKSVETEAGGYTRRPSIESVNGGVIWLQDDEVTPLVRIPDGNGGWEYPTLIVKNDTYEEPADLKAWALEHISEYTRPRVSYEAEVAQFVRAGLNPHGVALGDEVVIVDRTFGDGGLRIDARVIKISGSVLDPSKTKLVIGNARESMAGQLAELSSQLNALSETVASASEFQATAAYMSNLLNRLNDEVNATGGYVYITQGQGQRTYDVAVSDPTVGREANQVVEIKGGNLRIANSRTSSGDWEWKTLLQSGHILADLVTAIKATAGYIGSAQSGNFWNLDTGEFRMAATSIIGDKSAQSMLDAYEATVTEVIYEFAVNTDTDHAPTSGWSTTQPTRQDGQYLWQRNGTVSASGTDYTSPFLISGRDGKDGTSVNILGSYNTLAELQAAHPTGNMGDSYIVAGDLYVWNGNAWEDVGRVQGPQGPAGQSVTVTSIQYGISNSASTQPSWSTTVPTSIDKGKWLWVKTNYSNNTSAITKSYTGTDGSDGKYVAIRSSTKVDGVTTLVLEEVNPETGQTTTRTLTINDGQDGPRGQQGAAGASSYVHIAWANSADGSVDFTVDGRYAANKSYLGVCTTDEEDDPQTWTSYSWSKIEGNTGADGVNIASMVPQWYLSTSSSQLSGGAWANQPQAYIPGRFYWERYEVHWSDNRPYTYTSEVPSKGVNAANSTANSALSKANTNETTLNTLNTQKGIFNKLTNNGTAQGLYLSGSDLYINATYIVSGLLSSKNGKVYFDLDNNELHCDKLVSTATSGDVAKFSAEIASATYTEGNAYGLALTNSAFVNGKLMIAAGQSSSLNTFKRPLLQSQYGVSLRATNSSLAVWDEYISMSTIHTSGASSYGPQIQLMGSKYSSGADINFYTYKGISIGAGGGGAVPITFSGNSIRFNYLSTTGNLGVSGNATVSGYLRVSGNKNREVKTKDYGPRLLHAYETPSPYFGDIGSAKTDEDGLCYVEIDDVFLETVRTDIAYQVFLQKCGAGDLWVEEKTQTYFVVKGTPNLAFDWEIKAHQIDFMSERLESSESVDLMNEELTDGSGSLESLYDTDLDYIRQIEALYETEESNEAA
jgi:hypothetical protein